MPARQPPSSPGAEDIAIAVLGFLVSDDERMVRFLALTGLEPGSIRESAGSPEFLAAVLDYVMSDEPLLLECAKALERTPEAIARAHRALNPVPFD